MIRRQGPWRHVEAVEFATLAWVDWFNTRRLLAPLGHVPPIEYEQAFYDRQATPAMGAGVNEPSLRRTRGDSVAQFVHTLRGRLELHFLPGYAPELNPDEFVWNHLKHNGVSKKPLRQDKSLRARVEEDLAVIKSRPALVRSFFRAPSVAYTTD